VAVAIHTRQTSHLPCIQVSGASALYPRNYEQRFGSYYEVFVRSGNVRFRRSFFASPPFAWEVVATSSGAASFPWQYMLPWRRVVLLYEDSGDVRITFSDDDGISWETPVLMVSGGTKPFGAVNPFDGTELVAAFIVASGKIQAYRRYAGANDYGTPFFLKDDGGVDLLFEDDTFAFTWGYEGPARLLMHCHIDGESGTATFWSADDGQTWTRFS
jgi:hypothetical protein